MSDLDEIIEVPVPKDCCSWGEISCVYTHESCKDCEPRLVRCSAQKGDHIIFVRKIDYLNWKMSGGKHE